MTIFVIDYVGRMADLAPSTGGAADVLEEKNELSYICVALDRWSVLFCLSIYHLYYCEKAEG